MYVIIMLSDLSFFGDAEPKDTILSLNVFLRLISYNCYNSPTVPFSNPELGFTVETKCLSVSFKVKITLLYPTVNCHNKISAKIKSTGIPQ